MLDSDLTQFFQLLGLDQDNIQICQLLSRHPNLTVLAISRLLSIPRTTIYRRLSELTQSGLVNENLSPQTSTYQLTSPYQLERLVHQKTDQSRLLDQLLPQIQSQLSQIDQQTKGLNRVLYFRGQEAIARMTWGALQTKDTFRCFTSYQYSELVGLKEANAFKQAWEKTGKLGRELYSDTYLQNLDQKPSLDTGKWPHWEARHLPDSVLKISHYMDIYNDIVAIYNWHDGEAYGMQIINQSLADFHKQLFDIAWNLSSSLSL